MYWLKMNLKNYKHIIEVFLLVKVTFLMVEPNFKISTASSYFEKAR